MATTPSSGLASIDRQAALHAAWGQLEPEELAAALRAMPTKLRNRVLSGHRTPSSKVSSTTARLFATNVARGGWRDRMRSADILTRPVTHDLGVAADACEGNLTDLAAEVVKRAEESGPGVVVLAAVAGLMGEPRRFAPVLVACDLAGYLGSDLVAIVEEIRPEVDDLLDEAARARAAAAASTEPDPERAEAAGPPESDQTGPAPLVELRGQALAAAAAATGALEAGRPADEADLAAIRRFGSTLVAEAGRLGVAAELDAVRAAADATERTAALDGLAARLRGLAGPETLERVIGEVRAAADRLAEDAALASRLKTLLQILDAEGPLARVALAGELRSLPAPPDPVLLDAALAGLLTAPEADPGTAAGGDRAEWSGRAAAAARTGGTEPVIEHATAQPLPLESAGAPQPSEASVEVEQAVAPGDAAAGAEPGAAESPAPEATTEPPAPATSDADGNTAPFDGAPSVDAARSTADAAVEAAAGGLGDIAAEAATAQTTTDDTGSDVESRASSITVTGTGTTADTGTDTDRLAATVQAPEPDVVPEVETAGEDAAGDELSSEPVNATLNGLVAHRRFGLAHHLAAVVGQDYRAEILAEAALAHGVRTSASPAAAEAVARAVSTTINVADTGSVVLRAAAQIRLALLDPASGAQTVVRQTIPALDGLPRLRDLAVAVAAAAEQGLVVPATGVAADVAELHEQAQAIASWAEDTLHRPPRQNRLYRGIEIWKGWMAPDGLLGRVLSLVASNDPAVIDQVREACAPVRDRSGRDNAINAADRHLRGGRPGNSGRIIGPARKHLLRNMDEIIDQALAWCEAQGALGGGDHATALREDLAATALRLRQPIAEELAVLDGDDWSTAAATAAAATLDETIGLLANEALRGSELGPAVALNRGLTLIADLELDADMEPRRLPNATEIVEAASTSRAEAFSARLAAGDFSAAEAILDLSVGPGDDFDDVQARQLLRSTERDALEHTERRWTALERRFAAARARGRIGAEDAARIGGLLLQAQPRSPEDGERRDLGRVLVELESLADDLAGAARRRRERIAADIAYARTDGELSEAWLERLEQLLDRDEVGAAEEYLHRAMAGEAPPAAADIDHRPDTGLAGVLAVGAPIDDAVVAAARAGGTAGALDFGAVTDLDRPSVADALDAWRAVSSSHPEDLAAALGPVLRLLGVIPTTFERSPEMRAASTRGRWFVDVIGDKSGHAYVPDFGSRSAGRRRLMLCWEDLPVSQMWDLAAANAPADQPVYVLRFGRLSAQARVELVRHARRRNGTSVAVIDDAVILACALAAAQSYDVTMRAVLPYAAPNPYDPDLLAGTPVEMFYGRRAEREKIKSPAGSSFISGGRRLGKTALLRSVQTELEGSDVLALLIVIQHVAAVPPNNPGELWPVLAARLIEAGVLAEGAGGTADEVSAGVRAWLGDNPERRLLLLLDECDFFLRADAMSSFANVVRLRDLMQYGDGRFKVVFSGLQHVARYRRLPNQPLSHLPQPLVIGPLDPASAAELVRRPLHALGWDITDAQVDRIVTYCACNPSVLQLACGQLLERLRDQQVPGLAPWPVPESVLNELLASPEVARGVRDRLFLTLELDHRYKLLAYLLAWRALNEGLGVAVSPAELRREAVEYWPEGFTGQNPDDVRALCDELVGLGVFAGDAEGGYRMLSPATVGLFGEVEDVNDELIGASELYEANVTAGAAGSRMSLGDGREARFSPLTAAQLADVVGMGATQLRIVAGSRALRAESLPEALATAARRLRVPTLELTGTTRRRWRDAMSAPPEGHVVVVSDMTVGRSEDSWEASITAARRRGAARTARGTRSAVLVAGPSDRWILRRMVTTADGVKGDLADVAVGLRRVDMSSLRAWDRIEELDLAHPLRQARLLEVTGGWPMLVERVIARMRQRPFDEAVEALAGELAIPEGARELLAAVGLDPADPDQPADPGLAATFARLVDTGWRETLGDLADLLEMDEDLQGEEEPAEALAILNLLAALDEDDDGEFGVEPVLARCAAVLRGHTLPA